MIRRPLGVRESAALGESAADMGRCMRELASETGRERDFEEVRDRPDARRETAGDGGAGREEVREVTEWVLRRWLWSSVSWESNNRGGGSRKDVLGDSVVGVDSWKGSRWKRERGTFSMEMIKRGRKERKKARDARWGLTAPFGVA